MCLGLMGDANIDYCDDDIDADYADSKNKNQFVELRQTAQANNVSTWT